MALMPVHARSFSQQTPEIQVVELGSLGNQLQFFPPQLTFKSGHLYKLQLSNPSQLKHYFTAKDFADAIWTRKAEVAGVEIKGKINNLELKPGAKVEWQFIPIQAGRYPLVCTIPGHAEAGMMGEIIVTDS
ncbi:MAG: sulfocyanin-like copper-binding protein [Cyanobacteriota bacterium]|nr:sulfocyanin-like copper-binding protein [Cyanobacteriota bacterium]